ncbi:hypothetical protein [Micromonospora sp. URMC 103]|uniref:hypothetical protein n=1 Tax=Micromonospora sp. URMC 103 TaxID=3423406 RepID=UPI003F19D676
MAAGDIVLTALRVVLAVAGLVLIVAGVRIAVTRRLPRRFRIGRPPADQRPQPVRVGGGVALVATGLLIQQVAQLVPMPRALAMGLILTALAVTLVAVGWFALRRG